MRKSGQATLFGESVVVLPEAFNIRNYYGACVVDDRVEKRLITLSGSLRLCFVVGLVRNDAPRYSEAILIDGEARRVLSHKSSCDGSPCYEPFAQTPEDIILPYRGLHIGALVCMDAAAGDDGASLERQRARHAPLVEEFGRCIGTKLLCVPARFGSSHPVAVAKSWSRHVSTVIANCGSAQMPSVIHFESGQICTASADGSAQIHLAAIPPPMPEVDRA